MNVETRASRVSTISSDLDLHSMDNHPDTLSTSAEMLGSWPELCRKLSSIQEEFRTNVSLVLTFAFVGGSTMVACSQDFQKLLVSVVAWTGAIVSSLHYFELKSKDRWILRKQVQDLLRADPSLMHRAEAAEAGVEWKDVG